MPELIKRQKNSFLLLLNRGLYRETIIEKAITKDKGWVKKNPAQRTYFVVELKTGEKEDVLDWSNYLFYLHKASA